ncbi:molybdopterin molybdotransferase MoeA [Jannaschia sp. M317]|uniref:molybdopterin molybdotransferase MoeA n=1 Tax=Jannaschia sp. M317 TaxID=2867011 RepID=UPI0021A88249|nr:molybdopterin molybdotransferase MoeA [Jannaschia sp. M317]UWQ16618.1 molybdopterin molybdotransferase MoeA [Jannaschia sp. M317]
MISVAEAQAHLLELAPLLPTETVPLRHAAGRVLADIVPARHDQPPFAASAMDGYAVTSHGPEPGDSFVVIGEAAAGRPIARPVKPGEAVRIFTGAAIPNGATHVLIQEDCDRDGDTISVLPTVGTGRNIRPAGGDFRIGDTPVPLGMASARQIALLAAMGVDRVPVRRKPTVAIVMTGDELRLPGASLAPGQIVASNGYGLAAMLERAGAQVRLLPIARDTADSLAATLDLVAKVDLLVTIGGASVGDHDLVAPALREWGVDMAFHRIAMRPGKPLMAGRRGTMAVIGLPGNPVSAMVCGTVFILPMIAAMQGLPTQPPRHQRPLAAPIGPNGPRQHYMRARRTETGAVHVSDRQDSSLLTVLAESDVLVIRPAHDGPKEAGAPVETIDLD